MSFKEIRQSSVIGCKYWEAGRDDAEKLYLNTRQPNSGTKGGEDGGCKQEVGVEGISCEEK